MHFQELLTEVQAYFKTNPVKLVQDPGGNPDEFVGTVQPSGQLPGRFSIIMGDCIQNLRSSLDYLIWELVLSAKGEPGRHNMFPICSSVEQFEQQAFKRRRLDGVATEAVNEIKSLQPYQEGKDFDKTILWVLDDLCNINKHRRVLLTELVAGPSDLELKMIDGESFGRVTRIDRGAKVGPFSIVDGPKGRGIKIDVDPKITAYVAISDGPVKDVEITLLLAETIKYVNATVFPRFERFFV